MTAPVELIPLISVSRYHSHLITASECLSQQLRFSQKFPFLPLCGAFHLFHHRFAGFFLLDALSRLCHNLTIALAAEWQTAGTLWACLLPCPTTAFPRRWSFIVGVNTSGVHCVWHQHQRQAGKGVQRGRHLSHFWARQ